MHRYATLYAMRMRCVLFAERVCVAVVAARRGRPVHVFRVGSRAKAARRFRQQVSFTFF